MAPEIELYPYVEDGLLELSIIAEDLAAAGFIDALEGLFAAVHELRQDANASVIYALDPAPDGRRRILIIGAAAQSEHAAKRALDSLRGTVIAIEAADGRPQH